VKWVKAFGRFWWDFLIGDTPELFVGSVAVLFAAALVAHAGGPRALTWAGLPLLVVGMLGVSLLRAARRR
jgi:hypothetical protein